MKPRLAIALILCFAMTASACPFCGDPNGQTLAGEYNSASLIVVGTLKNWQRNLQDPEKNTTELHLTSIIKDHPYLTGRKMVVLPRYFPPPDPAKPDTPVLIFASVYPKSQDTLLAALSGGLVLGDFNRYIFDPYRGDVMSGKGELAEYLKGAMVLREKPAPERLAFYFHYLDAQDLAICNDAFLEFAQSDYRDVRIFAEKADAEKIANWLKNPNTPRSQFGLLGMMLGHSKRGQDAELIRKMLDDPKTYAGGIDGILAGYILLKPQEGWDYLVTNMLDPKAKFDVRMSGLSAIRFFWEYRPDVVPREKLLAGLRKLLEIDDICDMPIDNLRKWNSDELTAEIVAMGKKPAITKNSFLRRAVVKYLLTMESRRPEARELLADYRRNQPEWVKAGEEALAQEKLAEEAKKEAANPPR